MRVSRLSGVWETAPCCEATVVWILPFQGQRCPSWYQKDSSLLLLVPASRTAPSTAPHCGALHLATSHLERKGWPQLPLEVVSSVPQLAPRAPRELTPSQAFFPCQEADCTLFTTLSASTGSPNYRTNLWSRRGLPMRDAGCYPCFLTSVRALRFNLRGKCPILFPLCCFWE